MPLIIVAAGIILLMVLMLMFRLNSFLSFVIVSIVVGIAEGMTLDKAVSSIETGIGNTLGYLVIIIGFGAMLGKMVADSGAAQRITTRIISAFGLKRIQTAVMLTGFIIGIPLFYDVGFVVLIPLIFTIAVSAELPLLYVGLPMLASLSVTHGFLPPHPAPTAILHTFGADMGKTMLYGIIVSIPVILLSGPVFYKLVKKVDAKPMDEFVKNRHLKEEEMPGLWISLFSSLMPVILIGLATVVKLLQIESSFTGRIICYLGNPVIAIIVSLLFSVYFLGILRGRKMKELMESLTHSVSSLTMVMLVIAGAGGLKQVLVDSGVNKYIGDALCNTGISPLILGWLIATILRISVGSATVAGITTAGIVLPLVSTSGVNPELMVLAIGSGSLMTAHVNDSGFWLVKEYFNLSVKDTLKTWTVMETCIGISGLAGVLILNFFISH
jgi:Gnt-I system high-affinity gluconate transporter